MPKKSKSDDENKTYSKAELDKIIAQRDEAKNKARALEVETNKVKKADLKRIEEDKLKASGFRSIAQKQRDRTRTDDSRKAIIRKCKD